MKKLGVQKRNFYVGFGGGFLIGLLALPFVSGEVDFGYWLLAFLIAVHLDVIFSFLFKLDMSPPFSPVLLVGAVNDRRWRFSAALFAALVIMPLLSYIGFLTYFAP